MEWLKSLVEQVQAQLMAALDAAIPAPPGELASACGTVQAAAASMSLWSWLVPWEALAAGIGIVTVGVVAALSIRLIRMAASVATGGGGA